MNLTSALLTVACHASQDDAAKYATPLQIACDTYAINTPLRLAAFFAQIGHESGSLSATEESFNYSISALTLTFPQQMPPALARQYGRQADEKSVPPARQQQIAALVYANRYGNGDAASGDGWAYRGSGLIQTTFRDNFASTGSALGIDLVANPDRLRCDASTAALSAAFFWQSHDLNALADLGQFDAITQRINPSMNGKVDRDLRYATAKTALGIR